jgi:hypothetical protein
MDYSTAVQVSWGNTPFMPEIRFIGAAKRHCSAPNHPLTSLLPSIYANPNEQLESFQHSGIHCVQVRNAVLSVSQAYRGRLIDTEVE